jgi:hypothetical protein
MMATAAVFLSLCCVGCSFYALVYPAWFQQHYKRDGNDVYQGFGLFAFYSTGSLETPFYASVTVLQYSDFCVDNYTVPNYMLGDGDTFHEVLCGKRMLSMKACTMAGAITSIVSLLMAIGAVYNPSAGWTERVVSFCTLAASIVQAVALVIWGALLQQTLYNIDSVNSAYTTCKADDSEWSCWFYGFSFWVCLASVIMLSIAGYTSSAGRAEKIRYFRREYERDLALAVQQSMEADAAAAQQQQQQAAYGAGGGGPAGNFVRSDTGSGFGYGQPHGQPYGQPQGYYGEQKPAGGYQQQPVGNVPLSGVSRTQSGHDVPPPNGEAVYPSYNGQRKNLSLLGRQPSGGVV